MNRKLNLQLFAEGGQDAELQGTVETKNLSAEELKAQISAANAKIAKLTNKADALASDNAAKTKQLRQYLTEEEQKEAAKREAEAERDRQFNEMQRKLVIMQSTNTYMDILEMSKETAQQYAEARADGDITRESEILRRHMKTLKAKVMQSFLAERGEVNAGHGDSETESPAVRLARTLPNYNTGIDENILKAYM